MQIAQIRRLKHNLDVVLSAHPYDGCVHPGTRHNSKCPISILIRSSGPMSAPPQTFACEGEQGKGRAKRGSLTEHQTPHGASERALASCPHRAIVQGVKVCLRALHQLPVHAAKNDLVDIGSAQLLQPLSSCNPCAILWFVEPNSPPNFISAEMAVSPRVLSGASLPWQPPCFAAIHALQQSQGRAAAAAADSRGRKTSVCRPPMLQAPLHVPRALCRCPVRRSSAEPPPSCPQTAPETQLARVRRPALRHASDAETRPFYRCGRPARTPRRHVSQCGQWCTPLAGVPPRTPCSSQSTRPERPRRSPRQLLVLGTWSSTRGTARQQGRAVVLRSGAAHAAWGVLAKAAQDPRHSANLHAARCTLTDALSSHCYSYL